METSASTPKDTTRNRKKRSRGKNPKESQRKSLNAHLLQLTTALETIAKGSKKNTARRERHLQQIALIQAQLNELDQQSDDPENASEAIISLQNFSSQAPMSPKPEHPHPAKARDPAFATSRDQGSDPLSGSTPAAAITRSTPSFGQQLNRIYGQPIPPPAGMSSAPSFGQKWRPSNGYVHPQSQPTGMPASSSFGQQWPRNNGHNSVPSSSRGTSVLGQQWHPSGAQSSSAVNRSTGAAGLEQQWQNPETQSFLSPNPLPGAPNFGQQDFRSYMGYSNTRVMSAVPPLVNQQRPFITYNHQIANSVAASNSVPQLWNNLTPQFRNLQTYTQPSLQNQHPSSNKFVQLPSRPAEAVASNASSRQTGRIQNNFVKVTADVPEDQRLEVNPDFGDGNQNTSRMKSGKWKTDRPRDPIVPPSKESGGVPEPSQKYLSFSNLPPVHAELPQPILLVIDLNGTILHRPSRARPTHFIERAHTKIFLKFVLDNFNVMIWSSAKPENVNAMCQQLFPGPLRQKLVAAWGRDRMGLTPSDYSKRVQVYKRLGLIWDNLEIQMGHPQSAQGRYWDQRNTVLLDDSTEKARSEPHNLVQVPEFEGKSEDRDILGDLSQYLIALKMQKDVSAFMRESPFKITVKP